MKNVYSSVVLVLLTINAFSARAEWIYSMYSGGYREWPVMTESMSETNHEVPVYRTWPTRPYEVLGSLRHDDPNKEWRTGEVNDVAREAKKKGANAIILRYGSEDSVTALTGFSGQARIARPQPTALAIRFLSADEIEKADRARHQLFDKVISAYPVQFNEEAGDLAFKFLLQSGFATATPAFEARFVEIMRRVQPKTKGDVSGDWLFKASLSHSGISSSDEQVFFGIAAVKHDGTNFVIVSRQGNLEFSYSGKSNGAKIDGQLGIKNLSAPAEGVVLDDKISLTYQALTSSGTAQGIVVLQRAEFKADVPAPGAAATKSQHL